MNTVIVDRGGNGPKRYAVVERVGCRCIDGKNRPVDGKTVGHIIDGAFVPRTTNTRSRPSKKATTPQVAEVSEGMGTPHTGLAGG